MHQWDCRLIPAYKFRGQLACLIEKLVLRRGGGGFLETLMDVKFLLNLAGLGVHPHAPGLDDHGWVAQKLAEQE